MARYTRDSLILSEGVSHAAAIQAWFEKRGPSGASYVGLPYKPPPADLGQAIIDECKPYGINPDFKASQISHETASWQSPIVRDKNNPSGIGAINSNAYGGAHTYATPREGIQASVAHLMGYLKGDGPWNALSPRYVLVKQAGNAGKVKAFKDLEQTWAWSPEDRYNATPLDQRYGGRIAALANDLAEFSKTIPESKPMPTLNVPGVPYRVAHIPKGNENRPGLPMEWDWITVHETSNYNAGANAEMHRQFVHNGGGSGGVSFQLVIDDSEAIELLPFNEAAWHAGDGYNGDGNRKSIGIELCVNQDGDFNQTLRNAAAVITALIATKGKGKEWVVQHNHWSGKNCPLLIRGSLPPAWSDLINMIGTAEAKGPVAPDGDDANRVYFPETGQYARFGFRGYWQRYGGLQFFGFPLTREFIAKDTGMTTQLYERYVLEWDAGEPNPEWQVRGRHIIKDGKALDLTAIVPSEAWDKEA